MLDKNVARYKVWSLYCPLGTCEAEHPPWLRYATSQCDHYSSALFYGFSAWPMLTA